MHTYVDVGVYTHAEHTYTHTHINAYYFLDTCMYNHSDSTHIWRFYILPRSGAIFGVTFGVYATEKIKVQTHKIHTHMYVYTVQRA